MQVTTFPTITYTPVVKNTVTRYAPMSIVSLKTMSKKIISHSNIDVKISSIDPRSTLPTGWEARTTLSGRTYYLNHVEKTTSWGA